MRQLTVKRIRLISLCIFGMFLFTACSNSFVIKNDTVDISSEKNKMRDHIIAGNINNNKNDTENISNEKKEKICDDIPTGNIRNVNISGNARSIIIEQGVSDNFEFYNADLNEDHQYVVTCDEDGNDLNINVMMEHTETSNNVFGSVIVLIPQNEFEKIEITGEFNQIHFYTMDSDVFIHANRSSLAVLRLTADQLDHNITLEGSELNSFRSVSVYLDKLPDNVKIEFNSLQKAAINDPYGLLSGDKLELGSGKPVISINNTEKIDLYVE